MNSTSDPMLTTPRHDGFLGFGDGLGGDLEDQNTLLAQELSSHDFMDEVMFATSPDNTLHSGASWKIDQLPQSSTQRSDSSPDYSSEESSSDDSGLHERKSSAMSFQTSPDVEIIGGAKMSLFNKPFDQANAVINMPPNAPQSCEISNALDNDVFDFDSAASSPTSSKVLKEGLVIDRPGSEAHSLGDQIFQGDRPVITEYAAFIQEKHQQATGKQEEMIAYRQSPTEKIFDSQRGKFKSGVFPAESCQPVLFNATNDSPGLAPAVPAGYDSILPSNSRLLIHPIPHKSRVETQIPIKMTLENPPPGATRLHLPTHTISKPKLIARPRPQPSPDTLELFAMLVCTSAMQDPVKKARALHNAAGQSRAAEQEHTGVLLQNTRYESEDSENALNGGEVRICTGCITRERKRAARKKSKKPEEEAAWQRDESRRVIVFNTHEVRSWEDSDDEPDSSLQSSRGRAGNGKCGRSKQIKMPMRIACYCRHHNEKLGFQVIISIKDHQNALIAQAMSQPIVITDDHKAQPFAVGSPVATVMMDNVLSWPESRAVPACAIIAEKNTQLSRNAFSSNDLATLQTTANPAPPNSFSPFASVTPQVLNSSNRQRPNRSRQVSPAASSGPLPKRRKPCPGNKLPESLQMTKSTRGVSQLTSPALNNTTNASFVSSINATAPSATQALQQPLQQLAPATQMTSSFPSGPPTPDSGAPDFFTPANQSQSFDITSSHPAYSTSSSRIQSRAPSPSSASLNSLPSLQRTTHRLTQPKPISTHSQQQIRPAIINKIIPAEGPMAGGIEVTCLGSGFYNGLEVMFGNALATTTTYWGETSVVCLLPPADRPGIVPVTLKHQYESVMQGVRPLAKQTFRYVDDEESDLIKQALIIMSQKMTGRMDDPGEIARQTLAQSRHRETSWNASAGGTGYYRGSSSHQSSSIGSLGTEATILGCLASIDIYDSSRATYLDLPRTNGQTMLHLAASLGYQRLVAALLSRGADPNITDRNGFSPLHIASLRGHGHIVSRLRFGGGNHLIRSRLGFTAADLATDRMVLQILKSRLHERSQSTGAWKPSSGSDSFTASELSESLRSRSFSLSEYENSSVLETSSESEDELIRSPTDSRRTWQQSRQDSGSAQDPPLEQSSSSTLAENISPAAAMVVWRNQIAAQIRDFQQSVEGMIPQLQMPTLAAIPPLSAMPNSQAQAMVRRFSSFVPQRSSRSNSPTTHATPVKDGEHRWWDFFTGSHSAQSSPPSYDEIFPESTAEDLDAKASAVSTAMSQNLKQNVDQGRISFIASSLAGAETSTQNLSPVRSLEEKTMRIVQVKEPKQLRKDKNLFFVWIPILLLIVVMAFSDKISDVRSCIYDAYQRIAHKVSLQITATIS